MSLRLEASAALLEAATAIGELRRPALLSWVSVDRSPVAIRESGSPWLPPKVRVDSLTLEGIMAIRFQLQTYLC